MTEKKYKIPMIFDYILTILIVSMFIAIFFGELFLSVIYFLTILINAVFFMLDKKYGEKLTDHRVTYFLFNTSNLIALISILGFNMDTYGVALIGVLVANIFVMICLLIVDVFLTPDGFFDKNWCSIINATKLCTAICCFTYLNNVISICYCIFALIFILIGTIIKVYVSIRLIKNQRLERAVIEAQAIAKTENQKENEVVETKSQSEISEVSSVKTESQNKVSNAETETQRASVDIAVIDKIIYSGYDE